MNGVVLTYSDFYKNDYNNIRKSQKRLAYGFKSHDLFRQIRDSDAKFALLYDKVTKSYVTLAAILDFPKYKGDHWIVPLQVMVFDFKLPRWEQETAMSRTLHHLQDCVITHDEMMLIVDYRRNRLDALGKFFESTE
jgi:hypothetical protein